MKKVFSILLCITIIFSVTTCFAAKTTEKPLKPLKSFFENLKGYEYDKFTKEWSYYQAWHHQYKDAYVNIGIQVDGDSESQMPPTFYCWIRDEKNRETIASVNKILVLVGDDVYTFEKVMEGETSSSVLLGKEAKGFLKALSKASSITVRLSYARASIDEEIKGKEYKTTLKAAAKAILDSNIWDYVDDTWKTFASLYAPTKN